MPQPDMYVIINSQGKTTLSLFYRALRIADKMVSNGIQLDASPVQPFLLMEEMTKLSESELEVLEDLTDNL